MARSLLQDEIKQSRPFASRRQEAFLSILKTADGLKRKVAAVLASTSLSPEQYNVLRILRGAGDEGLPTLEVASRLVEQNPAITRLMDKLEAKGLIRRMRCDKDRRQVLCWITEAGLELLKELDGPIAKSDGEWLRDLTDAELEQLISLLDRVRESK